MNSQPTVVRMDPPKPCPPRVFMICLTIFLSVCTICDSFDHAADQKTRRTRIETEARNQSIRDQMRALTGTINEEPDEDECTHSPKLGT